MKINIDRIEQMYTYYTRVNFSIERFQIIDVSNFSFFIYFKDDKAKFSIKKETKNHGVGFFFGGKTCLGLTRPINY
jgi:hypothetical protein